MSTTLDEKDYDDLYVDNYYDYHSLLHGRNNFRSDNFTVNKIDEQNSSTIIRMSLTILLRVGFFLVQIGSVPVGNVNLILLQNIVDFCTVTVVSIFLGFVIAFTGDIAGLIGEGVWIGDGKANAIEALIGWSGALTASAICTSCIVGRTHAVGYLLSGILISGIVQPLIVHWSCTPRGWMADNTLRGRPVSFKDYGAGGTVHIVGGLAGFLGCATLGRRILRLRDIDEASLSTDSPGVALAGYFFILLGLQGFVIPIAAQGASKPTSKILVNNLLAGSSSSLLVVALHFALSREAFNYWTVMRCVQGAISGIVAVASAVDVYSPLITIGIGCSSGLLFYLVSRRVYRSALEDYCNIVAAHLTSALFGSFVAPLCSRARVSDAHINHTMVLDIAWQVICIIASLLLVIATMGPLFGLLECSGFLRNRSEFVNHRRAMTALERGPPRSYMQRLFFPGIDSLYLEPGSIANSEKGPRTINPRLWRYQEELTRLEERRIRQQGGNNMSEIVDEIVDPSSTVDSSNTDDVVLPRIKKPRQIHTLPKNDDSSGSHDVEIIGESTKGEKGATSEVSLRKSNVVPIQGDSEVSLEEIKQRLNAGEDKADDHVKNEKHSRDILVNVLVTEPRNE